MVQVNVLFAGEQVDVTYVSVAANSNVEYATGLDLRYIRENRSYRVSISNRARAT
jgi:hypothetical protein